MGKDAINEIIVGWQNVPLSEDTSLKSKIRVEVDSCEGNPNLSPGISTSRASTFSKLVGDRAKRRRGLLQDFQERRNR